MRKSIFNRHSSELGFGSKNVGAGNRFLNRDGSVNIRRKARNFFESYDVFHSLINMSWTRFLFLVLLLYFVVNCLFAFIYFNLGISSFGNLHSKGPLETFEDLFFFSAQTLTTVGYGYVYPVSTSASTVAAVESMLGLLSFALATGLLYARFSRPKASILYSDKMLVSPYKGISGLMFRIVNPKRNELIEIEAQVTVSMVNPDTQARIFLQLPLELSKINFLSINWTIVHPIDEQSPIYGMSHEDLIRANAEFLVMIKAVNDTYSQLVYSRSSYKAQEMVFGAKFKPFTLSDSKNGKTIVDTTALSEYVPAELPFMKVVESA